MLFRNSIKNEERQVFTLDDENIFKFLGIDIDGFDVRGKNALKEITVFTCFKILTEGIGKLPLNIYKNKKKASDHPLSYLVKVRPNPLMSPTDFKRTVEFQRLLTGNGIVYIDVKKGVVKGLYPLETEDVEIWIDDKGLTDRKMWYVIKLSDGERVKVSSDYILHFKGMTSNGLVGMSVFDYMKCVIQNAKSGQDVLNAFYKNGMTTAGIIHYTGDLNREAKETFRKGFEEMANGIKNVNKISMMPYGYQYQPIANKLADSQFFENNSLSVRQITSAFGIKLHQVNDMSKATYSNIAQQNREMYEGTYQPILTSYEEEFNYKAFDIKDIRDGYYSKFNVDSILRSDIKTRYEAHRIAIQNGFKTPNEVRELEDDEPLQGADKLMCNGNFIPVEDIGKQYDK